MIALKSILRKLIERYTGPVEDDIQTELHGLLAKLAQNYPPKILVRVSIEIGKWDRKAVEYAVLDLYAYGSLASVLNRSGGSMEEAANILAVADSMLTR